MGLIEMTRKIKDSEREIASSWLIGMVMVVIVGDIFFLGWGLTIGDGEMHP